MTRPTLLPEWAMSGANILEPVASKKSSGWVAGEAPPAGWLNWWQRLNHDWLQYVSVHGSVSSLLDAREIASGGSDLLQTFAASPTRIVAAGANGKIYSSTDVGRTWTARTAAGSYVGTFQCALWTGSLFILGGTTFANQLQTSPDGTTWTARTLSASNPVGGLAKRSNTSLILAIESGSGGALHRSTDGITWTSSAFGVSLEAIAVADGKPFVMAKSGGGVTRANMIMYTTHAPGHASEGTSWAEVNLTALLAADEFVTRVVYYPPLGFVGAVFGTGNVKRAVVVSADGVTWERRGDGLATFAHTLASKLVALPSGLVIDPTTTTDASLLFSADGKTWESAPKSGFANAATVQMGAMTLALASGPTNGSLRVSRPLL